MRVILQTLITQ